MKIIITKTGRRHYYYEKGDEVKVLSDDTTITVESVDVKEKKIIDNTGVVYSLTTDIRPTKGTLKSAKIEDRKVIEDIISDKEVLFAKLKDDVKIPNKDEENGAYDVYANFEEDFMAIPPHSTVMIPTKLLSAFSSKYVFILKERGSTGTKGMGQRAGVIDSGYRGEWLVPITNTNDKTIVISKSDVTWTEKYKSETIVYPYEKAICQAILVEVPKVKIREITADELKAIPSKRGDGKLGSSGK
jgi:dUTP pyrophosphatase